MDNAVQMQKLESQGEERPAVKLTCEGQQLSIVFESHYLGTIFAANSPQQFDVDSRIVMTMTRCEMWTIKTHL